MPNVGLQLNTELSVKTRLETLYYFVYEMAESFGADDALDSIKKGILDRKVIGEIIINYKDGSNVVVGQATIKIDWEKHAVSDSTSYGNSFTFDSTKSIHSQIAEILDTIVEHVQNMRRELKIKKISTHIHTYPKSEMTKKNAVKHGHIWGTFLQRNEKFLFRKNSLRLLSLCPINFPK